MGVVVFGDRDIDRLVLQVGAGGSAISVDEAVRRAVCSSQSPGGGSSAITGIVWGHKVNGAWDITNIVNEFGLEAVGGFKV